MQVHLVNSKRPYPWVNLAPKHPRCISVSCRDRVLNFIAPYISIVFLNKVQGGNTSNLNENIHGMIWNHVSETKPVDISLMRLGVGFGVIRFNDEFAGV